MVTSPNPELRYAFLEDTWVILATGRLDRPQDYAPPAGPDNSFQACPFEPGREHLTPPEALALRDPGSPPNGPGWRVRVFPNKYPALDPSLPPRSLVPQPHATHAAYGYHEVVVETPEHQAHPAFWDLITWRDVLWVWRERMRQLFQKPEIAYVQLFKNHGREAGASLVHPHSQLMALPAVPQAVERRLRQMHRFYQQQERCYLCVEGEQESGSVRFLFQNQAFGVYCPFASRMPFEMRILPRHHQARFWETPEATLLPLAEALQAALAALYHTLGDVAFNLVLYTAPAPGRAGLPDADLEACAHWYLEVLPRTGILAGFEMATGWYVNPIPPEEAARQLRTGQLQLGSPSQEGNPG